MIESAFVAYGSRRVLETEIGSGFASISISFIFKILLEQMQTVFEIDVPIWMGAFRSFLFLIFKWAYLQVIYQIIACRKESEF